MLLRHFVFATFFVIHSFSVAIAADIDPLWTKVIASNNEAKKWVAKDIAQVIHATKDGDPTKTVSIKKQLSGWEKGIAQYTITSVTPPPKDSNTKPASFDFEKMLAPLESELFSPAAKVKRSDNQVLNGKTYVMFEVSESSGKLRVWVDPTSGHMQKRVLEMSMPLAFEGIITTLYQIDANGINLPVETESKIDIKIPFKKAKIDMKDSYMNWVPQAK